MISWQIDKSSYLVAIYLRFWTATEVRVSLSAYVYRYDSVLKKTLFINILKSTGPKIDPWGTLSSILTHCFLFER